MKCKCGATAENRECLHDGLIVGTARICDACWASWMTGLEYWRHEFGVLIDRGVENVEANRQIIARMEVVDFAPNESVGP